MSAHPADFPGDPEAAHRLRLAREVEVGVDRLQRCREVFVRWLGESYDLLALDAVLAAAAVEQLDGDPVWLLLVSGSGNAKTETVSALLGAGAHVTSTITSEGALLSATSNKEKAKDATGGLLRKIGASGVLVVKDVTSILSMNRDSRAAVLAALREVYDGRWERNVGTDGGKTLTWTGRIVLVGAVTTAYDAAHAVIAAMGDRFALVRVDSNLGRLEAGRQALLNVGHEDEMRRDLSDAAAACLAHVDPQRAELTDEVMGVLLTAANVVTLARTAVERDHRGEVVEAHAPEAPTRFAKMLGQLVRGSLALGSTKVEALAVALRVAGDSVPPMRLLVLADVLDNSYARTSEVTKRVQRPRSTVDRTLQELHLLGLVEVDEVGDGLGWRYRVAPSVDQQALRVLVTRNVTTPGVRVKEVPLATDIPGDGPAQESAW
ncbi:MAG: ArsR family transcriptional regulator [Mycobacteriales bacterium]|nr:ArsR family transcriptional regulator [Mycobacteriales bacterium]